VGLLPVDEKEYEKVVANLETKYEGCDGEMKKKKKEERGYRISYETAVR
jgi:hypothetical protein